ncbi:Ig-like domain-containing protein [Emticicia soli]|uniref:M12 family metallo-peptidase n=1 Tax=Emticicia soli TaxID=2027878 RepID=A0ABW5J5Y5_9BACT
MKKTLPLLLLLILCLKNNSLLAQEKLTDLFTSPALTNVNALSSETKQFVDNLASARLLAINKPIHSVLLNKKNAYQINIPTQNRGNLELELSPANITSADFKLKTQDGDIPFTLPTFYWGKVVGAEKSFVALTVTDNGIEGIIEADNYKFTLGKIKGQNTDLHIVYETNDIPIDTPIETHEPIGVEENTVKQIDKVLPDNSGNNPINNAENGCRIIRIYMEADYQTYLDLGSNTTNVLNYVTAIFNNVAKLYMNEGVSIVLSKLSIWTTADRYRGANNSQQALYIFDDYSFTDGDIAHLISTRGLGGGIAYYYINSPSVYGGMTTRAVFKDCSKSAAYGVSGSLWTSVVNIPTYSWNVNVIAHELGHNFGLPHTHSCTWPGGAIDNCGPSYGYYEGSCNPPSIPSNTGTVMSYCHLNFGMNFAYGFGPKPGDKMRAEVAAAGCLGQTTLTPPTTTANSRCGTGTVTLNASGCTGGTLNWYASSAGTTIINTGTSFTTPTLTSNATYYVDCTVRVCSSSRISVTATITSTPVAPTTTSRSRCGTGTVTLSAAGCAGGTIHWYGGATGGSSLGTGTSFITPTISENATYYVGCTVGSCASASRTSVVATVTTAPTAPTTTPASRCGTGTVILNAGGCIGGTINWYTASTGGTSVGTGTSFTTPSISGNTTYYVACTVGSCTSTTRTSVIASITALPAIPTVSDKNRCGAGTLVLTATGCSGGTINWYAASTGGTTIATGGSFTTPSLSATTTYYTACTVGSCTSARTAVKAIIGTNPAAPTLTDKSRCGTGTVVLTATGCSGGTINWYSASSGGSSLGVGGSFTTPSLSASTTYYAGCTVGTCTSTRASVIATININLAFGKINQSAGTYASSQTITSAANVGNPTSYSAGKSITLSPGFQAGTNETFTARIQNCQ